MRTYLIAAALLTLSSPLSAGSVLAENLSDIKERMVDRYWMVEQLKSKGVVGENKEGYLEFLGTQGEGAGFVIEENRDRRRVYEIIAGKTGASIDEVARQRALQIRDNAKRGTLIQDEEGRWLKK